MLNRFFKSGCVAVIAWLSCGSMSALYAQHHGGGHHSGGGGSMHHHSGGGGSFGGYSGHHHHSGGNLYIGGGGIGIGFGSGYPYRSGYYGGYGYNSLNYSTGYRGGYYNSYPSYSSSVIVTPQYVTPSTNYVYQSPAPTAVYQSPTVQSSRVVSGSSISTGQPTNLPGVTFGGRAHITELANAVAERTNLLCVDLHQSYSGNPQFKEVYRDTYLLITSAKQLSQVSGDAQQTLSIVSDMNAILQSVTPAIESWRPTSNGAGSSTSHLSGVTTAIKLLSIDAGWDANATAQRAVAPRQIESQPTATPVAPAPEGTTFEPTPTPADSAPVPAP